MVLKYNKAARWLMGVRPDAFCSVPNAVFLRRCSLGLFGCVCGLALLAAAFNGGLISIAKQDLNNVSKDLVLFSTGISMIQKYFIFILQERGITRITVWLIKVKKRNEKNMNKPSRIEVILTRVKKFFYYGGNLTPYIMTALPLLHGEEYCFKFPYLDHSNKLLLVPITLITHVVVAMELTYDAACLINMLLTFRSELLRLSNEWATMQHLDVDKDLYGKLMKERVEQHVELLAIFKDLKKLNNAMFGYQVFASALPTCSMIYGCSKDAEFMREATTQVLPIFLFAIIEFILLCWLGEEITSGVLGTSLMMTNWYESNPKCKRAISIVLEFNKKRQVLTGFTVISASLQTFVETMKQSFSLFTLMQAMG